MIKPASAVLWVMIVIEPVLGQTTSNVYYHPNTSARSSSLTDDWQRQHPLTSGWRLLSVSVVDSMNVWASGSHDSAAGLIVKTTDGGESWSEVTRSLPFIVSGIHFITSALGWVVGGSSNPGQTGYVCRTTDSGQSWQNQITAPNLAWRSVFFLDAARGWVVGDSGKILATTNAGVDWYAQYSRPGMVFKDIVFLPNGTGWCGGTGVLKTTNFGEQWDSVSNIKPSQISFLNDSIGWAVDAWGDFAGFSWVTTNGGRSWTTGPRLTDVYPTDVAMVSDSLPIATMWDRRVDPPFFYYPISMGNLITLLPPIETRARMLFGISFTKSGHGLAVGVDEIISSRDSGRTWINQIGPWTPYLMSIDILDDSVGWVVGQNELIMKTTDGGGNWKTQTPARAGELYGLSAVDRQHAFAGGTVFISTTNGGTTWLRGPTPGNSIIAGLSFVDSRTGWAATNSYAVFHTIDGGVTWVQQGVSARVWAIDFIDSSYGWCSGESGVVFATTNGGLTWIVQILGPVSVFSSIDFVDRNYGWVAGENMIMRTTNGGAQWVTSDSSIHAGYRAVHFVNRDTGWAVGEQGRIVATTNGGQTWIVQRAGGSPGDRGLYSIDAISSHHVWISGDLGEILHTTNGGGITSVATVYSGTPARFMLQQNYPNPFNPSTTIRYNLPFDTRVTLTVLNVIGQEVATLVNEEQKAGYRSVEWNAAGMASGTYFYRIQAGGYTSVKKLVLLK